MVTYNQSLLATPDNVLKNSLRVKVKRTSSVPIRNGTEFTYDAVDNDGIRRLVIRIFNNSKYLSNKFIWVWCPCEYFTYTCEVALALKGSSEIKLSNGMSPKKTNPLIKPIVCKHIVASFTHIFRNP